MRQEWDETKPKGPPTEGAGLPEALAFLAKWHETLQEYVFQEGRIKYGLNIFNIDPAPNTDLEAMLGEEQRLKTIWALTEEWMNMYDEWKGTRIVLTDTAAMASSALEFTKKLHKHGKDMIMKSWGCRLDLDQRVNAHLLEL